MEDRNGLLILQLAGKAMELADSALKLCGMQANGDPSQMNILRDDCRRCGNDINPEKKQAISYEVSQIQAAAGYITNLIKDPEKVTTDREQGNESKNRPKVCYESKSLQERRILDPTSGNRRIWFQKDRPDVQYGDICDPSDRNIYYASDTICDFRDLPYPDNSFYLVVFDPPHLVNAENFFLKANHPNESKDWRKVIQDGFRECMRVLRQNGVLIFRWIDYEVPLSEILPLFLPEVPLFGNQDPIQSRMHWVCFFKDTPIDLRMKPEGRNASK